MTARDSKETSSLAVSVAEDILQCVPFWKLIHSRRVCVEGGVRGLLNSLTHFQSGAPRNCYPHDPHAFYDILTP